MNTIGSPFSVITLFHKTVVNELLLSCPCEQNSYGK